MNYVESKSIKRARTLNNGSICQATDGTWYASLFGGGYWAVISSNNRALICAQKVATIRRMRDKAPYGSPTRERLTMRLVRMTGQRNPAV